jgi:hypothetical protein
MVPPTSWGMTGGWNLALVTLLNRTLPVCQ